MEVITLTTYLNKISNTAKAIRADEVPVFCQTVLNRYKKTHGSKISMHQLLAVVNLSNSRMVRMKGKVWDAVSDGDCLWFVKVDEWQDYTDNHLVHEPTFRHGKRILVRHPSFLSPEKLLHFISQYFDDCKPLMDKSKRWVSPNVIDNSRRLSSEEKSPSPLMHHDSFRPSALDMNFVNALKEALVSPPPMSYTLMGSPFPAPSTQQYDNSEPNFHNMFAADEEKRLSQSTFDDLSRISDLSGELMQGLPSFEPAVAAGEPLVDVEPAEPSLEPQPKESEMLQIYTNPTENDDVTDVQSTIIPVSFAKENIESILSPPAIPPHKSAPKLSEEELNVADSVTFSAPSFAAPMTLQEKIELANVLNNIVEQVVATPLIKMTEAKEELIDELQAAPAPTSTVFADNLLSSVDDNNTISSMPSFGQSADSLLDYERIALVREVKVSLFRCYLYVWLMFVLIVDIFNSSTIIT